MRCRVRLVAWIWRRATHKVERRGTSEASYHTARLAPLQQYYLHIVNDGTPELDAIGEMRKSGALKQCWSEKGGNEYEAVKRIDPHAPLFVYPGELCDDSAFPPEHARWVKKLEYTRTYIDGYPYKDDGKTIRFPETHRGSLLNESDEGPPTAYFKDIVPRALSRGPGRGMFPPLKIVCAGSKGIAAGQKVTVKYEQWCGASGVTHPHRDVESSAMMEEIATEQAAPAPDEVRSTTRPRVPLSRGSPLMCAVAVQNA